MAMVVITNGDIASKVPMSAFQSQYKDLGFSIVNGETDNTADTGNVENPENTNDNSDDTTDKGSDETNDVDDDAEDEGDDEEEDEQDKDAEEAAFVEDILEKPLSQWTVDELKEFVRIKDIDTTGAKKTSEVRAIVKKFLEEQDKAAVNS